MLCVTEYWSQGAQQGGSGAQHYIFFVKGEYMRKFVLRAALLAVFTLLMAGTAMAEGFGLYEWSARGIALGGATVARKPDASCVAYNPALLARLPGKHVMVGASAIQPTGSVKVAGVGRTSADEKTWFVPHLYYTHQLSERVTFGIGEFSRFGLGVKYPSNWPGRFNVNEVDLSTMSVNPNIAIAVTDKFSVAVGVEVLYVDMTLKKRAGFSLPGGIGFQEVGSDIDGATDLAAGYNLAMHYQFNEQWAAGLTYRGQVSIQPEGPLTYSKEQYTGNPAGKPFADAGYAANFHDGNAHATVVLPDSVSGAVAFTPMPELSFELGATWTRWSTFRALRIYVPEPIGVSESTKHWKDSWRINAGVEYEALDWLTLRAGYTYDQSPMTDAHEDYMVPTSHRNIYSAGLGFKWNDWTLDLAYAYYDIAGRSYRADSVEHTVKSKSEADANVFALSIGYEF